MTDDFELKRAVDALPREIAPPEGAWAGIRARLAPRAAQPWYQRPSLRIAALLALLAVSAAALVLGRESAGHWSLATRGADERTLAAGDRIVTGERAVRLTVGTIGTVDVDPGTRAELLEAKWSAHRLALRVGTIHARIDAPPRLFVVETPAGTAVDLGCAYTLEVDGGGRSTIHVTAGWVSFERRGEAALIPAGMRATMRPGGRLGTPVRDSALAPLRSAVAAFDSTGGDSAITAILREARAADAVTLWHLAGRTEGAQRRLVVDQLTRLVRPPAGVERSALLANDQRAMRLYWTALPGTLPIVPGWRRSLWLVWLRVFG